jgi:hypothetical protein
MSPSLTQSSIGLAILALAVHAEADGTPLPG